MELLHEEKVASAYNKILDERLPYHASDEDVAQLSPRDQTIFLIVHFDGELLNGGFEQWLRNPTGAFVNETLLALQRIGATTSADLVQKVVRMLPHGALPRDWQERNAECDSLSSEQWAELSTLSDVYGGYGGREGGRIFELVYRYLLTAEKEDREES